MARRREFALWPINGCPLTFPRRSLPVACPLRSVSTPEHRSTKRQLPPFQRMNDPTGTRVHRSKDHITPNSGCAIVSGHNASSRHNHQPQPQALTLFALPHPHSLHELLYIHPNVIPTNTCSTRSPEFGALHANSPSSPSTLINPRFHGFRTKSTEIRVGARDRTLRNHECTVESSGSIAGSGGTKAGTGTAGRPREGDGIGWDVIDVAQTDRPSAGASTLQLLDRPIDRRRRVHRSAPQRSV